MHRDTAEATGIVRHSRIERIENPGYDVVDRASLGFVEPGRHAIDVVAQIDLDLPFLAVDADLDLDRYAVGNRRERIVRAGVDEVAARKLLYRMNHPPLRVVEPCGDELPHQIEAVLGDKFLEPPLGDPRRAELGQIND